MANSANKQVICRLKTYLTENGWLEKAKSKNPDFASKMESLTEDKISFGHQPTLIRGYIQGNATGTGESTYGDTKTRRTTSINFNTDEKLFIWDCNKASLETCRAAARYVMDAFAPSDVLTIDDAQSVAEKHGKKLCREALSDLDFDMNEYRLNRYNIQMTSDAFRVPIWPIYARVKTAKGNEKEIPIGYYYTYKDENYIYLDINVPLTGKQKLLIFGVIAGIVVVGIALLSLLI